MAIIILTVYYLIIPALHIVYSTLPMQAVSISVLLSDYICRLNAYMAYTAVPAYF